MELEIIKLQKKNDRNKKGKKKFNFLKILMIVNIIKNIDFFRVRYTLTIYSNDFYISTNITDYKG